MDTRLSTGAAYSTSVATLIAGLTLNDWAAAAGIIGVIGTLAINWYFRRAEKIRAQEEHEVRLSKERVELKLAELEFERQSGQA